MMPMPNMILLSVFFAWESTGKVKVRVQEPRDIDIVDAIKSTIERQASYLHPRTAIENGNSYFLLSPLIAPVPPQGGNQKGEGSWGGRGNKREFLSLF